MEEKTRLRNEMDCRIYLLFNKKNVRRVYQICKMGEHGERTYPEGVDVQRLHAYDELAKQKAAEKLYIYPVIQQSNLPP